MKRIKGLALGTSVAAFLAAGGLLLASQVFAATGWAHISDGSAGLGGQGTVDLDAFDVTDPGLGAWTVDIFYDPEVITAVECSAAQGGVCNAEFADDVVRITGAVAVGLEGDSSLGTVTFECGDAAGESPLELDLFTFADGTLGGPLPIDAQIANGTFTCADAAATATLPVTGVSDTGTGGGDSNSMTFVIAALAGLGLASMAAFGALRVRSSRA